MKAAFDRLCISVRELALQDRATVSIVEAERGEITAIAAALERFESESRVDAVHAFQVPFDDANAWTLRTMLHLERARAERVEDLAAHGISAQPLPPLCRSTELTPLARCREAIAHLVADVEAPGLLVVALLPVEIASLEAFAEFVVELASVVDPTRVRLLVRERPDDYVLRNALDARGVSYVVRRAGTTPRDLEIQLHRDVANDALPPIARAQALLQIGLLDFAHRRYDEAFLRLGIASSLFENTGATSCVPLALHTLAKTQQARGAPLNEVAALLREAVRRAREAQEWMTLSLAGQDLGQLCFEQGLLDDAERYFIEVTHTARTVVNVSLVASATLGLGDVASARERHAEAQHYWASAAQLADALGDHTMAATANGRLGGLYELAGMRPEAHSHRCAEHEHTHSFQCEVVRVRAKLEQPLP